MLPPYDPEPDVTERLWRWLYEQPRVQHIRLVPLPTPPSSLQGSCLDAGQTSAPDSSRPGTTCKDLVHDP